MVAKLCRQLGLLLGKNWAVHRASPFLTFVQLTLPVLFGLVLFLMKADDLYSRDGFNRDTFEDRNPAVHHIGKLPLCADALKAPAADCVPLAIVQKRTDLGDRLVDTLLAANPHVDVGSVARYETLEELNTWVINRPNALVAAVVLPDDLQLRPADGGSPSFVVQYNMTKSCAFGSFYCTQPWRDVLMPVQVEVERAFLQLAYENVTGSAASGDEQTIVTLGVGTAGFPHPEITGSQRDLSSLIGTQFMVLALMGGFFIKLKRLVEEKESRLKLSMRMMGTTDTAMWLAWGLFFLADGLINLGAFLLVIYALDYTWMIKNDLSLVASVFGLAWLATASWAAAFAGVVKESKTAIYVGLMLTYIIDQLRENSAILFTSALPAWAHRLLSVLFPPLLFVKGFEDLRQSSTDGLRWEDRFDNGAQCSIDCVAICPCYTDQTIPTRILPLNDVITWLLYDAIIWAVLAVYLDQVVPAISAGRAEPAFFFLDPAYWSGKPGMLKTSSLTTDEPDVGDDRDVKDEAARVMADVNSHGGKPSSGEAYAIVAVNLKKSFGPEGKQNLCEKAVRDERDAAKARGEAWTPRMLYANTAVYNITVGIPKEKLFCLLGHNGAGKTTTFNMLSGVFAPTAGDAFVFGRSVKTQLKGVQSMMGICPQHDVLWPELSANEHLRLFAGLSMMEASSIEAKVNEFVSGVDLVAAAKRPSGTYSGGMRRRLSVACSLIADPKALYLDEPTTGMDPVNRRGVWDLLEKAKVGRTIVLTTHAMEEADALGDTVSIMSRGRLCCLGSSLKLKMQHAPYYHVESTLASASAQERALELIRPHASTCAASGDTGIKAEVGLEQVGQLCVATEGEEGKALGLDLAVSMASLEDVFIKLAGDAATYEKAMEKEARERKNKKKLKELKGQICVGFIIIYMLPFFVMMYFNEKKRQKKEAAQLKKDEEEEAAAKEERASVAAATAAMRDREITTPALRFEPTPFGRQFRTLARKNVTVQRRMKIVLPAPPNSPCKCACSVTFCLVLTLLFMVALLFVGEQVIGLIISGTVVTCASDVTVAGWAMPQDFMVTLPNVEALNEVKGALSSLAAETSASCTNLTAVEEVRAKREALQTTVREALGLELSRRYEGGERRANMYNPNSSWIDQAYGSLNGLTSSVLCARLGITKPGEESISEFYALSDAFSCNTSYFIDELMPAYTYAREADTTRADFCVPGPNISYYDRENGNWTDKAYVECGGWGGGSGTASRSFMNTCERPAERLASCPDETDIAGATNTTVTYACSNAAVSRYTAVTAATSLADLVEDAVDDVNDASTSSALSCYVDTICDLVAQRSPSAWMCEGVVELVMAHYDTALGNASAEFGSGDSSAFPWYRATCADPSPSASGGTGRRLALAQQLTPAADLSSSSLLGGGGGGGRAALPMTPATPKDATTYQNAQVAKKAVDVIGKILGHNLVAPGVPDVVEKFVMRAAEATGAAEAMAAAAADYAATSMLPDGEMIPFWPPSHDHPDHHRRALQTRAAQWWQVALCTRAATPTCEAEAVIDTCGQTLASFREKRLPFTAPSLSGGELAALGSKSYDISGITSGASGCVESGSCVDELLGSSVVASGMLGNFTVRGYMDELSRELTFPTLTCLEEAGGCGASLADAQAYLYDRWYTANRSDIEYPVPGPQTILGWWNAQEGAYQGVYTWNAFSPSSQTYNFTLSTNTTHWTDGFGDLIGVFIEIFAGSFASMYHADVEVPALVHRMSNALYKQVLGEADVELGFGVRAHPTAGSEFKGISMMRLFAPYAIPTMFAFCYCVMAYALVKEKHEKMRLVGEMAGLGFAPYWLINWLYNYLIFLMQFVIVCACGYTIMGGFAIFTAHSPVVIVLFYLLYGAAMTSFTCFVTTFFSKPIICAIFMALLTFFIGPLAGNSTADNALLSGAPDSLKMVVLMLLPNLALSNGVMLLAATTGDPAGRNARSLTLANIAMGSEAPMASVLLMLAVDLVLYTVLFLYLDKVLPIGPGVPAHPLFFLSPRYWCGRQRQRSSRVSSTSEPGGAAVELQSLALPAERDEPADVTGERTRVLREQVGGIRAIGLHKTYPGRSTPAVVNLQFGILPGECFGLLGSNGAGKSTAIHMLCGLHAPSGGTMLAGADGLDLRYDLREIQSSMGVCSQDNLLYDNLTGPEHLKFFAGLRRVKSASVAAHTTFWLKRVGLNSTSDRKKLSSQYSGGMKRRLGVANAFVGNPQLVYLDEPSTGLDPQSRRDLWHAVRTAQEGKSIVLTTHALDEAQELCARVAIMGFGQIRTIGTPSALRLRFDEGLRFILTVSEEQYANGADAFVLSLGDGIVRRDAIQCTRTYEVPRGTVTMSVLFEKVQANKEALHIADWGLTHPSLENVFLQVVAQTALKTSAVKPAVVDA